MTIHTLSVLLAIFELLRIAFYVGLSAANQIHNKEARAAGSLLFGLPATVFEIWLLCAILF